ncbi:hypothetical protein AVEN_136612-1 [Araneus ventricosus]|uniref:Uncharacterized protein n=1 Tax=Araneus ventricosus TaxID=182803 RepID=A0A4Y2C9C7_ARAVE|nr:hypothetical protein AVEN_136612-1 [Araneus ventricosus]
MIPLWQASGVRQPVLLWGDYSSSLRRAPDSLSYDSSRRSECAILNECPFSGWDLNRSLKYPRPGDKEPFNDEPPGISRWMGIFIGCNSIIREESPGRARFFFCP